MENELSELKKLTPKQRRFCDEYLVDSNATKAAIRVGYAEKSASVQATRLMMLPQVKAYLDEQLELIHTQNIADTTEILEYLTSVLRGVNLSEVVVIEGEGDGCSTARRMEKAPDEKERLKAAELLGKRYGIFTDKLDVKGSIPIVICDDLQGDFNVRDENKQGDESG